MIITWILAVLLAGIGLFLALRPALFWRFAERWKSYYADEPSDLYFNSSRIAGAALTVCAVAVAVLPYVLP